MLDIAGRPTQKWQLIRRDQWGEAYGIKQILGALAPGKLICQQLHPRLQGAARPNTLSSRHGLGVFPPHTDFATSDTPPRYLVLASPLPRPADTLIYDTDELVSKFGIEYLQRSLYLLRGRTSRYCRLVSIRGDKKLFRYNGAVMAPQNDEAFAVTHHIETSLSATFHIDWTAYRMAILDNWSVMHGRAALDSPLDIGLHRFAVWGNNDLDN